MLSTSLIKHFLPYYSTASSDDLSDTRSRSPLERKSHKSRSHKKKKRHYSSESLDSEQSYERKHSRKTSAHKKKRRGNDSSDSSDSDQSIERKLAERDKKKRDEFLKEKEERR